VSALPANTCSVAYFHPKLLIYLTQLSLLCLSLSRRSAAGFRASTPIPCSACTAETSRMPGLSSNHEASRLPAEQSLCTMDTDSDACFPRITGVPFATRRLSQPLAGACISAAAGTRDETQPCRQPFPSLSPVPAQLCLRYLEHPALTQALTRPRKPREICRGVVYSSSHVCTADQHSCEPACCRWHPGDVWWHAPGTSLSASSQRGSVFPMWST
jgi:hypothetical protein